ncbi:AAA family ATPase [Fodinicola feengrottensis]|uniref:AAA family ATPase n=1 Tax=Fodinicola feengrottensis TaxID=435914 RepID=UPI0024425621|nr:AAA family ATPase [Fodinicola feengrottensis]
MRLVATKLLIPPGWPGLVPRAAALRLLDGVLSRPLTLVTAPPGFGKTTLVSTWLREQSVRSGWLTLDEDDDVPARFLDYLLTVAGGLGDEVADLARTLLMASPQSVPAVVAALVNDLAAVPAEMVLVLDDFHVIAEPEILDVLSFLVERCPPRLHLVLISRHEPDLPLARWRGRVVLAEVGAAQLRFSAAEAGALLRSGVTGSAVDERTVTALHQRAEGWAAGLQMLGIGLRDGLPSAASVTYRSGDRYVLDYLAEEVLRGQPAERRDFFCCVRPFLTG